MSEVEVIQHERVKLLKYEPNRDISIEQNIKQAPLMALKKLLMNIKMCKN